MRLSHYIWSLVERFGASALSLIGNIALAAMLTPDDFGLIAMLGVFTSVVYALVDCGLSDGLLREANPSRRDFNTLFYFNVTVGVAIGLVFVLISPSVATLFHRTELRGVMSALGLGAVFCGLSISQATRLRSMMRFRHLAIINIASVAIALSASLLMAWHGCGYWSLVTLQVGYSLAYCLMLALSLRWELCWEFDVARFKQLWGFGVNLLFSTLVIHVSQNIIASVIGQHSSATQAGYMGQAQKLQQTPVSALETSVSNTTFVSVAKEPSSRQDAAFVRVYSLFTLALLTSCLMGIVLSKALISCIFPVRWMPVAPYLQLLLCWAMVYPVGNFLTVMLKLRNRTAAIRNIIVIERIAIIISALTLYRQGIPIMIGAFTIASLLAVLCYMWQCSQLSTIHLSQLVRIYLFNLLLATGIAATLWLMTQWLTPWLSLLTGALLWGICAAVTFRHYKSTNSPIDAD